MSHPHGRFVWYDLATIDTNAAVDFYTQVVGWTTTDWKSGDFTYHMWTPPDASPIGGVGKLPQAAIDMGAPPNWSGHISVPDINAALTKLESLGGKRVMPEIMDMPTIGKMILVADPYGAAFWLFQPVTPMEQPEGGSTVGHVTWHELTTDDVEGAMAFYTDMFGFHKTESMDMGPMGTYQMFGPEGKGTFGGMMKRAPGMPPNAWLYYFSVPDLTVSIAKATELGGKLIMGPQEVPGGDHIAVLMDPQGAAFALHSRKV